MFSKLLNKCNRIYVMVQMALVSLSPRLFVAFLCAFLRNQGNELMNEHFGLVSINDKPSAIDRKWCSFSLSCVPIARSLVHPFLRLAGSVTIAKYCFHCLAECLSCLSLILSVDQDYPYICAIE